MLRVMARSEVVRGLKVVMAVSQGELLSQW